ncbi:hypothetical protein HanRHA438_Chr10g0444751 [Helianthus annuus]|nr:hypothetical protein HanHA300_Chr10g0355581 [Helianthus annuus]KAJ0529380.1 hypothetical protein HanHA89_Chr10g0377171 [Helianthus annuus]KAJ0878865.1 hypothetical protein HanRHA438_Chr10g0444751 [Helianthus annuus]
MRRGLGHGLGTSAHVTTPGGLGFRRFCIGCPIIHVSTHAPNPRPTIPHGLI